MSRGAGAKAMLTIPIIGWVAKLGGDRNKLASFSIQKYGAQTGSDWQWFPDAGNGVLSATGQSVTNNDFTDANVQVDS
ncbi:cellulase, partial [Lacticaseibacillus rhamnosus]